MQLHGTIRKIFRYEENTGAATFAFKAEEPVREQFLTTYGTVICTGRITNSLFKKVDTVSFLLDGEFYTDGKFVSGTISVDENNKKKLIDYISGGICPGIGRTLAEKIAEIDGFTDVDEFVKRNDAVKKLASIKGVSLKKAHEFIRAIREDNETKHIYKFINRFGGSYYYASQIFNKYGENAFELLKKQPYKVCYEVNIPFKLAEKIGASLNISKYNHDRIMSLTRYILATDLSAGNTEISVKRFVTRAKRYDIPVQLLLASISGMNDISYKNGYLFFNRIRKMEEEIVVHARRLNENKIVRSLPANLRQEVEAESGIRYTDVQAGVFNVVSSSGIKVMTGGPGTGKTTTIKGVINAFRKIKENPKIRLAAPTGRAAQRLSETVGEEYTAQTVHKLLDYTPFGTGYTSKDEYDEIDADLIIIDEFPMVDIELFHMLIKAVKKETVLLLSGDIGQLPSVGAGAIMKDMMSSGLFETHRLDVIFRQANGSAIISNSQKISKGRFDLVTGNDFYIFDTPDSANSIMTLDALMGKLYKKETPFSCQILCPSRMNTLGISSLNKRYEPVMNNSGMAPYVSDEKEFRPGDKILFTRNNYKTGYFNGEIGIVKSYSGEGILVKRENDEILVKGANVADIELAYAMTIHKAQGSEYENVIVVLPKMAQNMLCRNLLFTAVTRAKKRVFIINESGSLQYAIAQVNHMERETGLKELFQKETEVK